MTDTSSKFFRPPTGENRSSYLYGFIDGCNAGRDETLAVIEKTKTVTESTVLDAELERRRQLAEVEILEAEARLRKATAELREIEAARRKRSAERQV